MPPISDGRTFDAGAARPILQTEIGEFGGAERSILGLADWLYEQGLPAFLLPYTHRGDIAQYAKHPLEVVELKPEGSVIDKVAALHRHLRSRPEGAPALLCSGYQASLHATLARERGFHSLMHDTPSLFSDAATRRLKNRLRLTVSNRILHYGLGSGGVTIVTSEHLQAECRNDFGVEARIQRMGGMTAEGSVSSAGHAAHAWSAGETLRMLSVCRIEANKRIDWLLEGLAELQGKAVSPLRKPLGEIVDWQLDLVGKGSKIDALTAMAAGLGIGERVRFHGFVPDEELETLYSRSHLFQMPALQGYGIPAIEALERGLPVLLHRESGVSDILLDTPWATVLFGGRENTAAALSKAIDGVLTQRPFAAPRPVIPTEAEWAEGVSRLCGWLPG